MPRGEVPSFTPELSLPGGSAGTLATPQDFGAQVGAAMQGFGEKINRGAETATDVAEMFKHMQSQQWVSKAMTDHRNTVDKFMADPKNYSDPNFAKNVSGLFDSATTGLQKQAPSLLARNQLNIEMNDFRSQRLESAYKTQTDVLMQKGYNDLFFSSNTMLDSYRTNLKSPNIDAGAELYKQADDLFTKIDRTYGVIAPSMARELKEQVTSQLAYGAVNTNPDLAEKLLNRGYIEGRTRHFLEDAIQTAHGAQEIGAKQEALDFTEGLLKKADMFPDQVFKGPDAKYYEAHGFTPKEAITMANHVQSLLDVNKDFGTARDKISGGNEDSLLKAQAQMYTDLKSLDPGSDKFDHDAKVYDRMDKFISKSIEVMHADPIKYLTTYNPEIRSAAQAYRENPSKDKFDTMTALTIRYQGAAPEGEDKGKYLNLAMHEQHVMDEQQAQDQVKDIMGSGPRDAGDKLHSIIQHYQPDYQALALNDLVNHGKLPVSAYVIERTHGAPFADKVTGAIMQAKELGETVGRQKGSTPEDIQKLLDGDNTWQQWSKVTAADNFQRQDIVAGFKGAIQAYAWGMIQDGKSPKEAVAGAVTDLTQWGHENVHVNGRTMQVPKNTYPGTSQEFAMAVSASIGRLDISGVKLTNDNHSPIFPVALMAGHTETRDAAIRSILQTKVFPNLNPDGKSFSLYVRGQDNDFQLRDKAGKPITMEIKDLPTFSYGTQAHQHSTMGMGYYREYMTTDPLTMTNWPTASGSSAEPKYGEMGYHYKTFDDGKLKPGEKSISDEP